MSKLENYNLEKNSKVLDDITNLSFDLVSFGYENNFKVTIIINNHEKSKFITSESEDFYVEKLFSDVVNELNKVCKNSIGLLEKVHSNKIN